MPQQRASSATAPEATNEALRASLTEVSGGGADLTDAAGAAERVRNALAQMTANSADAATLKRFDNKATAAVHKATELVNVATLNRWEQLGQNVVAEAKAGIAALAKYRDAEDLVANEGIDATVLDATAS